MHLNEIKGRWEARAQQNTTKKENAKFHPTVEFHAALTYWLGEQARKTTQTANQHLANKFHSPPASSSYCNYLF